MRYLSSPGTGEGARRADEGLEIKTDVDCPYLESKKGALNKPQNHVAIATFRCGE